MAEDFSLTEWLELALYVITTVVTYVVARAANQITNSANQITKATLRPFLHLELKRNSARAVAVSAKNSGTGPAVISGFGFRIPPGGGKEGGGCKVLDQPLVLFRPPEVDPCAGGGEGEEEGGEGAKVEVEEGVAVDLVNARDEVVSRPVNVDVEVEDMLTDPKPSFKSGDSPNCVVAPGESLELLSVKLSKVATEKVGRLVHNNVNDFKAGSKWEYEHIPSQQHIKNWKKYCECVRAQLHGAQVWLEYENCLGEKIPRLEGVLNFPPLRSEAYDELAG
eukprot:evm.model.scf_752.8 EVM.evm.TU.scf_752.8   scf_752:55838-60065(-)